MTQDYKKNLLKYVSDNVVEGTPTTDEIIKEQINVNRSKWINYIPNSWVDFHFDNILKDKKSNKYILYGGYRASGSTSVDDEVYGIIVLLDENLEPYKTYYEYDNGTKLRTILIMNQAEDGTFYFIDDTSFTNYNNTSVNTNPRFVMVNNFVLENNLVFRTSYILPYRTNTDIAYWFSFRKLEKNPNQAQYVIITDYAKFNAHGSQGGGLLVWFNGVCCIELNIPYGESPVWTWTEIAKGRSASEDPFSTGYYRSSFIKFEENQYLVKAICSSEVNNVMGYRYYFKNYTDNSFSITLITTFTDALKVFNKTILDQQDIFINENECYFVESNLDKYLSVAGIIELYHYDTSTNSLTTIYSNSYPAPQQAEYNRKEAIFLAQNEGKLYIQYLLCTGENYADYQYNYYFQRYEGTWNPILVGEDQLCQTQYRSFYVNNNYNLLKIFLYPNNPRSATWYFKILKEVYNQNQYNGEPYANKNMLTPLYSNLYSNGSLVFSRNRYNTTTFENTSTTSIEVPNTFLNDLTITQEDLISSTNYTLLSNLQDIQKNIYETLHINYFTTINVIDEDTDKTYKLGAIKINQATTNGGDRNYNNAPCIKYRVNYIDNTTIVGNITWTTIDDYNKETHFTISANKEIKNIELISNDETTTYLIINGDFEIGKNYSITQKVRIE